MILSGPYGAVVGVWGEPMSHYQTCRKQIINQGNIVQYYLYNLRNNNNKNQSKRLSSHHEHENYSSTIRLTYQIVLTYYVLVLIFFMNFFVFFFFCFFICFILFFVFLTTSYDYVWGKWNGFGCLRLLKRWIRRR